jgi:chorismate synthase
MSHNTFGHLFRVTTWGESHGPAIGCVVDGCPPGIRLDAADIQVWLDKRRPGAGKFVTQRQEPDAVRILSGVFEDEAARERFGGQVTTGTPISLMIDNVARGTIPRSPALSGRATPTTPISPSTACATIAAAAGSRPGRRPRASPPGP